MSTYLEANQDLYTYRYQLELWGELLSSEVEYQRDIESYFIRAKYKKGTLPTHILQVEILRMVGLTGIIFEEIEPEVRQNDNIVTVQEVEQDLTYIIPSEKLELLDPENV